MKDALASKPGAQVIQIEGAPTDNNATLFTNGQEKVLQPLYDSGALKLVQKQPIEKWDNQIGGQTFEQILTGNGGKVDGVVAANDGLAGAIITVLQKYGLNGKVPVTGQDATPDGLQAILRGDQYMTVYKRSRRRPGPPPSSPPRWPRVTRPPPTRSPRPPRRIRRATATSSPCSSRRSRSPRRT